jgi:hypothetical protein
MRYPCRAKRALRLYLPFNMLKVERRVKWRFGFYRYGCTWHLRIGKLGFYFA